MSDIVERLRESVRACRAIDRSELLEEAAAEIERLRGTLTDAEREAIEYAASSILGRDKPFGWPVPQETQRRARLLRGLLKRLCVSEDRYTGGVSVTTKPK